MVINRNKWKLKIYRNYLLINKIDKIRQKNRLRNRYFIIGHYICYFHAQKCVFCPIDYKNWTLYRWKQYHFFPFFILRRLQVRFCSYLLEFTFVFSFYLNILEIYLNICKDTTFVISNLYALLFLRYKKIDTKVSISLIAFFD